MAWRSAQGAAAARGSMSDDVRGARYVGLERAETALHGRARHATERRAALEEELALAPQLSEALFELALQLGGTISGEHGIGFVKRNWLGRQLGPRAFELHNAVKRAFDPQNLLNPGKKA